MDISICVCTFRRPELLSQLLASLPLQFPPGLACEVIVVDNDLARSAAAVLAEVRHQVPDLVLRDFHVTTPNIALARNAGVAAAAGVWIALIDDDEIPDPEWLSNLLQTATQTGADAVFGPVYPHYPNDTPTWIRQGGFFEPDQRPTGTRLPSRQAFSGNALIRRAALQGLPGPFDPDFGTTGGSDTMLFWEMQRRGASLVWCAEAVAREHIPAARLTAAWIVRRGYRGGQSFMRAEVSRLHGRARLGRSLALGLRAILQLPVAIALALFYRPWARAASVRWQRTAAAQLGKLTALAGHRYHEYAS